MEMQIDVLSRNNGELTKNNKGLLTKIKVWIKFNELVVSEN